MKKVIFLCLLLIISCFNIYAIQKAKAQEKVKESFHHTFSKVNTSVSLTAGILTGYVAFRLRCKAK